MTNQRLSLQRVSTWIRVLLQMVTGAAQCMVTVGVLMLIYMVFVILDYDGGFDRFIGTVFIQPILGLVVSGITIFICAVIGTPLRVVPILHAWWTKHFYIAVIGALLGILLLTLSVLPPLRETAVIDMDGDTHIREIPNGLLAVSGWFMTAFFTLHAFPPKILMDAVLRSASRLVNWVSLQYK